MSDPYEGLECGMCGESINKGEWCGNEDCPLGPDPEETPSEKETVPPKDPPSGMPPHEEVED